MNHKKMNTLVFLGCIVTSTLLLGGCFRKHIVSTPPAQRPASKTTSATTTSKPIVVEEKATPVEDTYVVNAAKQEEQASIAESDLAEESTAAKQAETEVKSMTPPVVEATPAKTSSNEITVTDESPAALVAEETAEAPQAATTPEMYYVQVGAFSELENAHNVLADLIEQGYKGSKLIATDTQMYRVQAGAFTDKETAEKALTTLQADFPKGFILKGAAE